MLNLQRMSLFVAVVDSGSFTAAAAASGQTKAVVSFNIRQLEKRAWRNVTATFHPTIDAHRRRRPLFTKKA
ncbi:LysR family transcriptional regulator [Salmonella enterica subsp. enterica serovar Adjame]|nr:LysR family transcriptional regulator [Salmonella enterica subsp. enterica serovar Adjame]